ncbi:MAG: hypothetical protein KAS32_23355 [Candidatus Peribacteraceae bacterium]|nr:hypothetical protein [Candidatus Peribacteraceae bacterium]
MKNKTRSLYIDDIRPCPPGYKLAWSYETAIECIIINGCPDHISFDHDLGTDKTGYDIAKYIVEYDLDHPGFIPDGFTFNVHSANPVGRANIEGLLNNYLSKKVNDVCLL